MRFRSSRQSGGKNEKGFRFLIFANTSILLEAAAHEKASKGPPTNARLSLL